MSLVIRFYNITDALAAKKQWKLYMTLLLTCLSLFFSFPSYGDLNTADWQELFTKAEHPFINSMAGYGSHDAKITFRLLMPLIAGALHLNIYGVLAITGIIGVFNFYLVLHLADKILQNRRLAIITGLCSCFIYFGKCSFTELRGCMFDGVAMCLLLSAMCVRSNIIKAILLFLCAWCDERGLIATALVWVYIVYEHREEAFIKRVFNKDTVALYMVWLAYLGIRYYLAHNYGLQTDMGGTGPRVLLNQINNIPIGMWSALEGLWIPVLFSFMLLYRQKEYFTLLKFAGACALILIVGVSVLDITRSVMYVFPAVFIALKIMRDNADEQTINRAMLFALVLCFAYPAYYTGGKSSIWWTYPLPLQLLRVI